MQRYLNELVRFGLIEKCKQYVKGQVRNVYRFLLHSVIGIRETTESENEVKNVPSQSLKQDRALPPDRHDKMSPRFRLDSISPPAAAKSDEFLPTDTTNCTDRHDKMSPSLNKEETIKGNNYNPPTPQTDVSITQGDPDCGLTGNGGDFSLESKEDDPDWASAKTILKNQMTVSNFMAWIDPLLFGRSDSEIILRCPNQFFMNWVKRNYSEKIAAALASCGLSEWCFDLMTEEQQAAAQAKQKGEKIEKTKTEMKSARPVEDVDSLSLEEQYDRLYQAYPRNYEGRKEGWEIFQQLHKKNRLPKASALIHAVNRAKNNNPSWQRDYGRYVPQIHKWLSKGRWMD